MAAGSNLDTVFCEPGCECRWYVNLHVHVPVSKALHGDSSDEENCSDFASKSTQMIHLTVETETTTNDFLFTGPDIILLHPILLII